MEEPPGGHAAAEANLVIRFTGECPVCGAHVAVGPADSAVTMTRHRAELRMDAHGLKVKNPWWTLEGKHVIAWDEVRWLRDNPRFSRRTRWMLEIVLKNGSRMQSAASCNRTPSADPQTLEAIRRAARHHAIPAVLTGSPSSAGMP